jgi:hypothetical protein
MLHMNRILPWLVAPMLAVMPFIARAQSADANVGRIEGTVLDTAGKPVRDAMVRAVSAVTMTDSAGHFLLPNVSAGTVTVEAQSVALGEPGSAVATVVVPAGKTTGASLTMRSPFAGTHRIDLRHPSTLLANPAAFMPLLGLVLLILVYARTDPRSMSGPSFALAGPVLLFVWPTFLAVWGAMFSGSPEKPAADNTWAAIALACLALCQPLMAWWTLARYRATRSLILLVLLALWSLVWTGYWWLMSAMAITHNAL